MRHSFLILLLIALSNRAVAQTKLDKATIDEYLKIQKEFNEKTCNLAVSKTFEELTQSYKGDGNFIPLTLNEHIDKTAIEKNLYLFKEKKEWLDKNIEFLKKTSSFDEIKKNIKRIENEMSLLLEAKKDFYFSKKEKNKTKIEEKSKKQFDQLVKEVNALSEAMPFLLSFKFPLDHLSLREKYDEARVISTNASRTLANSIYMQRKIMQDGSFDEQLLKNDSAIRAGFDTLFLSLTSKKKQYFLSENERSDLVFVIRNIRLLLDQSPVQYIARLQEWKNRTQRAEEFYQGLLDSLDKKKSTAAKKEAINKMLEERATALLKLKDFVLRKESETYEFWTTKSELFQYLYAMETILYAEVGRIDAPDALERRDVAQVVVNRFDNPKYNFLSKEDSIFNYINKDIDVKKHKWLNVMFKEGEFSFTYFYIPGNFHIYCPDVSKVGQFLRRENLRIAINLTGKPRKDFNGLRYFSRMSMYGRIEMDSLWKDYVALDEVPGKAVNNPKELYEIFKQDQYKFLYSFENKIKKKKYLVVEMKKKTYVVDAENSKQIYYYRNPHHFRYFSPIK